MKCINCGIELTPSNKSNSYGLCKSCKREEDNSWSYGTTYYSDDSGDCHSTFDSNDSCDCDCGCGD